MRTDVSVIGLLSLLASTAFCQWDGNRSLGSHSYQRDGENSIVRGQVSSDKPLVGLFTLELLSARQTAVVSVSLDPSGGFEFHGVAPGSYRLRLTGAAGAVIYEEPVFITDGYQHLSIQVPVKAQTSRSDDATVSLKQLQHKVPGEAQKEFGKGNAASMKGDQPRALDHFQKAVKLDPEFAEAFNSIGTTYATLGDLQQAADHFQKAIDLVPDHVGATANLSIVLCRLKRYREAGELARRALKINPALFKLRYVLGISLMNEGGSRVEALDNLQRATVEVPGAHLLVARILAENGRREEAAQHLDDYLRSSGDRETDRSAVEAWIEQLRR